jgi:hypothetical protein
VPVEDGPEGGHVIGAQPKRGGPVDGPNYVGLGELSVQPCAGHQDRDRNGEVTAGGECEAIGQRAPQLGFVATGDGVTPDVHDDDMVGSCDLYQLGGLATHADGAARRVEQHKCVGEVTGEAGQRGGGRRPRFGRRDDGVVAAAKCFNRLRRLRAPRPPQQHPPAPPP